MKIGDFNLIIGWSEIDSHGLFFVTNGSRYVTHQLIKQEAEKFRTIIDTVIIVEKTETYY